MPVDRYHLLVKKSESLAQRYKSYWYIDVQNSITRHCRPMCTSVGRGTIRFLVNNEYFRSLLSPSIGDGGGLHPTRMTAKELQVAIKSELGVDVSLANIFKARTQVESGSWDDYRDSYLLLEKWIEEYTSLNKGSRGVVMSPVRSSRGNSFSGAFLANGTIIHLVKTVGLRLLGQDFCHITHRWYSGKVMVIEARLGTNTIVPLAVGVFASWKEEGSVAGDETEENTAFMWDQLKATGLNEWLSRESGPLTIITDRGKAILAGVRRAMPEADVIFCCFHLLCNINQHCREQHAPCLTKKGKRTCPATEPFFWQAQSAVTVRQFDEAMTLLQEHNPVAHDYLDAIDHKCWARYAQCKEPNDSSGNRGSYIRTYGVRCNNNTESENARLRHNLSRSSDPSLYLPSSSQG
mmetsp:Transcript_6272/g.22306  ORF Transcript_6272/g.22306 Transcript_6272/m.22306 type:complete len:407 (-) Transcript_6272:882-2102(-)